MSNDNQGVGPWGEDNFDKAVAEMPEMQTLDLKPYVKSPKECPKCGRGPIPVPAWFIRTLDLAWSRFKIGYCRGGVPAVVEHDMGPFGKHEHHPICAGVQEPHLHVTCSNCEHSYLMKTRDAH